MRRNATPFATRRRPRPRSRFFAALAACAGVACAALALPLAAQPTASPTPATTEASLALTTLAGGVEWMATAAALLGLTPQLSLGGGGSVLLGSRARPGSARGTDQELRTGYGGLLLQLEVAHREERGLWIRLLAGAGNAKLRLAASRLQIASDNFGVVVPEVGGTIPLAGPVRVGAALAYRAVLGVEDLPGLAPSDLRGPAVRVLVSVHRF